MQMRYSLNGLHLTEQFEGLYLAAYPDPASPLARKLQAEGGWQRLLANAMRGVAYTPTADDPSGEPWTAGWGHTGPDVKPGGVYTRAKCEIWLQRNIGAAEENVNQNVTRSDLKQGEFDALVDFAFNCGIKNLDGSTLLRLVNEGDDAHAADEFEKWSHAGGHVVAGLLRRRLAEKAEFLS